MTDTPKNDASAPTQAQIDLALQGTDSGSDTRAGSLRGGSASGSDIDPDQAVINKRLAEEGQELKQEGTRPAGGPEQAKKTDQAPDDDADAATG